MSSDLSPTPPHSWSPSSYNRLVTCPLQAAFYFDTDYHHRFVRSNTFSALGTVSHRFSERCQRGDWDSVPDAELNVQLRRDYQSEVDVVYKDLCNQWAPAPVPLSRDWPFFNKKMAITVSEAMRIIRQRRGEDQELSDHGAAPGRGHAMSDVSLAPPSIEFELEDQTIALRGRPDRVVYDTDSFDVVDLKSGAATPEFTEAYRRQLTLYAHLVSQKTGLRPRAIVIESASGDQVTEAVTSRSINAVIATFRSDTAHFAEMCTTPRAFLEAATPSIDNCRYCDFKVACPAYWKSLSTTWEAGSILGTAREDARETSVTLVVTSPLDSPIKEVAVTDLIHDGISSGSNVAVTGGYLSGNRLQCRWDSRLLVEWSPIA